MWYVGIFKGVFEHTELSIHLESFNDENAIANENPGRKSVESGIKTNAC